MRYPHTLKHQKVLDLVRPVLEEGRAAQTIVEEIRDPPYRRHGNLSSRHEGHGPAVHYDSIRNRQDYHPCRRSKTAMELKCKRVN